VADQRALAEAVGSQFLLVSTRPDAIDLTLCPGNAEAADDRGTSAPGVAPGVTADDPRTLR
jgi:hypothetical protein